MSLVSNLMEMRAAGQTSLANPAQWLLDLANGGAASVSGRNVTPSSALTSVAVYACVSLLADTISSLPLPVYRRLANGGKERARSHRLYRLLHDAPNPEMTASDLRAAMVGHLCTWGNFFAEVERDANDRPLYVWPLRPDRMQIRRRDGQLEYLYSTETRGDVLLTQREVWHVRGLSSNGVIGYSPITLAREPIGLALAMEEFGARFFGNGSRLSGILTMPGKLTPDNRQIVKDSWEGAHKGLTNSHRVAVLDNGISWQQIGVPPEDAQFLESRKFQRAEIESLYRIPPHMISDTERSTSWGTGIEQQSIGFVTYTLRPWLVRIEQSATQTLLGEAEREAFFVEHLVDGLLRGDAKARAEALAIQRQNGIVCADEWREIENRNPLPDGQGKVYLVNAAMVPIDQAGRPQTPATGGKANG
jgi:HK97 family phage portal protein